MRLRPVYGELPGNTAFFTQSLDLVVLCANAKIHTMRRAGLKRNALVLPTSLSEPCWLQIIACRQQILFKYQLQGRACLYDYWHIKKFIFTSEIHPWSGKVHFSQSIFAFKSTTLWILLNIQYYLNFVFKIMYQQLLFSFYFS